MKMNINMKKVEQRKKLSKNLPSVSYATSELLGPHLPDFTGVGDKAATFSVGNSYSLNNVSNGDNDEPRKSRLSGGKLPARQADGEGNGGTLLARAARLDGPILYGLSLFVGKIEKKNL